MTKKIIALEFLEELESIHKNESLHLSIKYPQLRSLLEKVCKNITSTASIQFANFFSRLNFVCQEHKVNRSIHGLRVTANKVLHEGLIPDETNYKYHISLFAEFLQVVYAIHVPDSLLLKEKPIKEFIAIKNVRLSEVKVSIVEKRENHLVCHIDVLSVKEPAFEFAPDKLVTVQILEDGINDVITSCKDFWAGAVLYLVDIDIDANEVFHPKIIVLEPDYLLDVSSVAECIQDYGETELLFLKSKFEPVANTKHILLGNFANLVVDEVFSNPLVPVEFGDTFVKHFRTSPFEYTTCKDIAERQHFSTYYQDGQRQFLKIKNTIENEFLQLGIDLENISLEPSFLSEKFGLQGRMDMLDWKKGGGLSKIIELKSGGTPFPDDGISIKGNHQAQLFMYYLLYSQVEKLSVGQINAKVQGFILYSKPDRGNMRNTGAFLNGFQKVINLRNKIIAIEHLLAKDNEQSTATLLAMINAQNIIQKDIHPNFRNKIEPQVDNFLKPIASASDLEKSYFISFLNYVSYEHFLSKVGSAEQDRENGSNGLARLWLDSFEEKKEKFEILYDLAITNNKIDEADQIIRFKRTNTENRHVNFRIGDICVLYPRNNESDMVSHSQIFKCTIKEITADSVTVYFRYKQRNKAFFTSFGTHAKWALESDFMEISFNSMYRNLYGFLKESSSFKNLILTQESPGKGKDYGYKNPFVSNEQQTVINKALSADRYFLLNGPPGTGKTSIIIKNLIKELIACGKSILVLAYTNRAVDELCDAINNACAGTNGRNFIRFGSQLSADAKYHDNLLDVIMETREKELRASGHRFDRAEVSRIIRENNVYVSTVASVGSKEHIFQVKNFDYIIVDEASQILEPQLVGILGKASKFVLIGDHKQLPAISLQSAERSKTNNGLLESIGLYNRKNSLFERLYKFCEENKHLSSYDTLTYQGRMHKDISLFPNFAFYKGLLREAYDAPGIDAPTKTALYRQVADLQFSESGTNSIRKLLSQKRLVFFNNKKVNDLYGKTNAYEADFVVYIVKEIIALYEGNDKPFDPLTTVGIIAPFRNQIALIKHKLEEEGISDYDKITVDSVERFQGSQRDIIIYSFSVNNPFQLRGMINLNDEGDVDRKLNVALTRAREQMVLVGNDAILSDNLIYLRLIEYCKSKGGYSNTPLSDILKGQPIYFPDGTSTAGETALSVISEPFKSVFENKVVTVVKNDRRTKWPNEILGLNTDFTRNNLIRYGTADFDAQIDFNYEQNVGFLDNQSLLDFYTPKENVLLYCYWNMRKNFVSVQHIFLQNKAFFLSRFEHTERRIMFIDFGCGPLTASLAFNTVFKAEVSRKVHYLGVDVSKAMLNKAQEFSESGVFKAMDTFDLCEGLEKNNPAYYKDEFTLPHTVVLTCANSLSNLDLDDVNGLAGFLNDFMSQYPLNNYILVYQNPVNRDQNLRKLLAKAPKLNKVFIAREETVSYDSPDQDWYATNEHFSYELITN
ncbi:AAA domain-containing protein [Elizabethkingia anophelis]|uniref:AAA domain-containing protein n=1 Tax=Elizabethkingia anophelis TaxID=1117645 RepID=UPI000BA851A2|nr:AAA domain-containing protein [Elizabethkingia anophelis]ASV78482.1 DNA helicase [Elizabethkingia anophelis]MCL1647684.1 AAA domain-containing protein [Elizabethkingia anophelis]MCL1683078.1 AAA domain-containing protein [Elizabethkingia anophelis]MDV3867731.1 DNA helicase [Elizabethkingia anophelis]MDV3962490.1 DNA helicase [Elizabethkingia anophelis]